MIGFCIVNMIHIILICWLLLVDGSRWIEFEFSWI